MKRSAGFTLIELVIVIIILGILAVTAAPKFLDLQDDAKKAAADGVKAAVASSAQIVYSKAVIKGYEKYGKDEGKQVTTADGKKVDLVYGYPAATLTGIGNAADIDPTWTPTVSSGTGTVSYVTSGSTCTVVYTEATSAAGVVSGATTLKTGC